MVPSEISSLNNSELNCLDKLVPYLNSASLARGNNSGGCSPWVYIRVSNVDLVWPNTEKWSIQETSNIQASFCLRFFERLGTARIAAKICAIAFLCFVSVLIWLAVFVLEISISSFCYQSNWYAVEMVIYWCSSPLLNSPSLQWYLTAMVKLWNAKIIVALAFNIKLLISSCLNRLSPLKMFPCSVAL